MHVSNNLLRKLDKDGVANQSAISFVIGTGSICWSKMGYKGSARSQRRYLATLSIRNDQLLLMRKMLNLQYGARKQNDLKTGGDFLNNKILIP